MSDIKMRFLFVRNRFIFRFYPIMGDYGAKLIGVTMDAKLARLMVAALNNMDIIAHNAHSVISARRVAQMFLSDVDEVSTDII